MKTKKRNRKYMSLALALVMTFCFACPAFAADVQEPAMEEDATPKYIVTYVLKVRDDIQLGEYVRCFTRIPTPSEEAAGTNALGLFQTGTDLYQDMTKCKGEWWYVSGLNTAGNWMTGYVNERWLDITIIGPVG